MKSFLTGCARFGTDLLGHIVTSASLNTFKENSIATSDNLRVYVSFSFETSSPVWPPWWKRWWHLMYPANRWPNFNLFTDSNILEAMTDRSVVAEVCPFSRSML